jgi:hypothetical protein
MAKFHYLVAQLPTLFFDRDPGISVADFLREAEKWMGEGEFQAFSSIRFDDPVVSETEPELLRAYREFEFDLRTDVALLRRARAAGVEYKPVYFPLQTVKEGTPLEVEKKLLRLRWDFLEDKTVGHNFDLQEIIAYYLKMQILERLGSFDKEKGKQTYHRLCGVQV